MRLLVLIFLVLGSGCVTRQVQTLTSLPLPDVQPQACCWQALQQLDIRYKDQAYKFHAALAVTEQGVTLVLLDTLGRRILSLSKRGKAIETYRAPELPETLPGEFILASSLLAWLPFSDWQELLAQPDNRQWQLGIDQHDRLLNYRGRPILRLRYKPQAVSVENGMGLWTVSGSETLELEHLYQPLRISITTERWDAL
jgi:hypothetical protein